MIKWQRILDLTPQWAMAVDESITVSHLAGVIANRLDKLESFKDENIDLEKELIIIKFEEYKNEAEEDKNIFDTIMSDLYDWGDWAIGEHSSFLSGKKVCWIKTMAES